MSEDGKRLFAGVSTDHADKDKYKNKGTNTQTTSKDTRTHIYGQRRTHQLMKFRGKP